MTKPPANKWPIVTLFLVFMNLVVYSWEKQALHMGLMEFLMKDYAFSWNEFLLSPFSQAPRLLSYTFFHADDLHLRSNLLFFILFASAVESGLGRIRFLLAYLVWGAAAAIVQGLFEPFTDGLIGASGAISGAAGAFFVLYPFKKPFGFIDRIFKVGMSWVPAFLLIGLWYGLEIYQGMTAVSPSFSAKFTPVAHWAHIGGFLAGALTTIPWVWRFKNTQE